MTELRDLLARTTEHALTYLDGASDRPVRRQVSAGELVAALGGPVPERPSDPAEVVDELARAVDPGLVVTNAGRYFGFVEGGVVPASLAADWLTSVWDQNPAFSALSPAATAAEEVCRGWLCELLSLPGTASAGFTSGAQLANLTGLAAGRHHVLRAAGWDVEADGLFGAPAVTVLAGQERHATVDRALRFLGFGTRSITPVPVDDQGRMRPDELERALGRGPAIVCAQAGNVNTGAADPLRRIGELTRAHDTWLHVDGAFGLWAAAVPELAHLTDGAELADSWAVDGHKWLNVPYDCGIVLCAHPDSHRAAMGLSAAYLARGGGRDGSDWSPESSRRARVFAVWAALRSLGRSGVAEMVRTCCAHARRCAELLASYEGITVLNDVVLNQVLIRVGDDDARTRAVAEAVQVEGATWLGTTTWRGSTAIRISVSDHATTHEHIDEAVRAVLRAARG
ncbi:Glutamate or tyrosine decarboxylase [Haloechinothrix alba]|uniref:Glutamate or tyrosine decarboxylase n=1 Tax=Haloechinothrix alba TaxID=664784 RepID=A0A238WNC9_9PSEU|nr:aminotransferase class V-fold PLP-dependent enzyme [Haloechinothrix alba]SNR48056.1 Glutamate or tyrosine decarboxylase [Haloechinothrix alba]